ncbi:carbon-nitrogen hydrolase family protein [Polaromonas sp. P1(28)-13]|nr:carbon-nitrogen hydrolase family protein [Polaromonas sp. P1(28)-13]
MSGTRFIAGCIQVCPDDDRQANIERACDAVQAAVRMGASLIAMPEYVSFLHASGKAMRMSALREEDDPALARFRQLAKEQRIWILIGSLVLAAGEEKAANRSFVISDSGDIVARYDKLHMFDATLPNGRMIRESSSYAQGNQAVLAQTPWGRLGMSICYDVRFPQLYRVLSQGGAEMLVVPSAFTKATGQMHWKTLIQARAIENAAYVLAPATCGTHPGGHETYGHAMIVDPTGKVIAQAGEAPDVICAEIDIAQVAAARGRIPSLLHDHPFELVSEPASRPTGDNT